MKTRLLIIVLLVAIAGGAAWWFLRGCDAGPGPDLATEALSPFPQSAPVAGWVDGLDVRIAAIAALRGREDLGLKAPLESVPARFFDTTQYVGFGVDLSKPVSVALIDVAAKTVAVSWAVTDEALAFKQFPALVAWATENSEDPDLKPVEAPVGDGPGYRMVGGAAAIFFANGRAVLVASGASGDGVAAAAKLRGLDAGARLGTSAELLKGIDGLQDAQSVLWVSDAMFTFLSEDEGGAGELTRVADLLKGLTFATYTDEDSIALVVRAQPETAESFGPYGKRAPRPTTVLTRIPGPVLAAAHGALPKDALDDLLALFAGTMGQGGIEGLAATIKQMSEDAGVDLQTEFIDQFTGEYGVALRSLPSLFNPMGTDVISFATVADEGRVKGAVDGLIKLRSVSEFSVTSEEVSGGVIWTADAGMLSPGLGLGAGALWGAANAKDLKAVLKGGAKPFTDERKMDDVETLVETEAVFVAFADLESIVPKVNRIFGGQGMAAAFMPYLDLLDMAFLSVSISDAGVAEQRYEMTFRSKADPMLRKGVTAVATPILLGGAVPYFMRTNEDMFPGF